MKKKINIYFFAISFFIHILALTLFIRIKDDKLTNKHFLVYGAHSKKPTFALFKPIKGKTQTNWLQKKIQENKKQLAEKKKRLAKIRAKKLAAKKAKPKPIKKVQTKKQVAKKQTTSIRKTDQKRKPIVKNNLKKKTPQTKSSIKKPSNKKQLEKTEEVHFNLMGTSDPKLIIYQQQIQKEVEKLWRPPIGVPKGTECSVQFTVDRNGNVSEFEVLKSSKILIYDLSILRIAKRFKFHKFLWGKKLTIDFRQ